MATKVSPLKETLKHGIMAFVLFFAFFPLYLMFVISFKNNDQFVANPFTFDAPGLWNWANWQKGWDAINGAIANTLVVTTGAVALCLMAALLTSYVLARYRFPGREVVYYGLVATMFLPGTAATLVTLFTLIINLNLFDSLWAIVLTGAVGGQVVCVFILRQFIEDIPKELFESAEIDGAGHLQQIWNIVLPMSGSVMGTLAIMQFIGNWNSLMLPLVAVPSKPVVTTGLMYLDGEYVKKWGELMAGYTIASIPLIVLFLFTMRLFVKGLSAGAVKG
ncbi:MAG TPA: carbohydrate ABC transporter permease [Tepidisphaeraceae bacterium]|jgi:ABC-type glycerol-3-phosphate transport system permease component|nr:carbohydrate ABC transporter permease [Tepidisphaeraceae bacterium]